MQLEPPRGMRDFYPGDLDLRDRIFAAWTDASTIHGFQRFEPPVVESFELLARRISAGPQQFVFPAKWWTIVQCFRYERMPRGRKREHFQWNLDVVGEP